jgi:hypothetical protein
MKNEFIIPDGRWKFWDFADLDPADLEFQSREATLTNHES